MPVTLNLGGIVFNDFEIPESMPFGGDQKLNVHKLPGGAASSTPWDRMKTRLAGRVAFEVRVLNNAA